MTNEILRNAILWLLFLIDVLQHQENVTRNVKNTKVTFFIVMDH